MLGNSAGFAGAVGSGRLFAAPPSFFRYVVPLHVERQREGGVVSTRAETVADVHRSLAGHMYMILMLTGDPKILWSRY